MSVIAALAMILALSACGGAGGSTDSDANGGKSETSSATESARLMVGYSRVNITPSYSVPLCGYGNSLDRFSQGMVSYLYTTCIAYSDGEDRVLVFRNDLTKSRGTVVESVRKAIGKSLGFRRQM